MHKIFYSILNNLIIPILLFGNFSCHGQSSENKWEVNNQNANVELIICSRGCYQYLIKIINKEEERYLYPVNLSDTLKSDNLNIIVSGIVKKDSVQIFKADARDIPIPIFKVPYIEIISAKKRE
jgi:hypothetical protein